jgi:predicted amidohydrolase YtcJ
MTGAPAHESSSVLIRDVDIDGQAGVDCRVVDGWIVAVGQDLSRRTDEPVLAGRGGALLPGLADHHIHLFAAAAAVDSLEADPSVAADRDAFAALLTTAAGDTPPDRWLRVVGYDDQVAGPLDADVLERMAPGTAVRVQHRGGGLWVLNRTACARAGVQDSDHPGVERDGTGRATGRLWRADDWLRERTSSGWPDLARVGRELAAYGVTHVTDATPELDGAAVDALRAATGNHQLPQRVQLLGAADDAVLSAALSLGPRKLVVRDDVAPDLDELIDRVVTSHRSGRPVAVHCVTQTSLAVALAALGAAGPMRGDRVEHAAVCDAPSAAALAALRLAVTTQPGLLARRGDRYLAEVDEADLPHLWPYASLLRAGVPVVCSSDAPYGPMDPWEVLVAARDRRTAGGRQVGPAESVEVAVALDGLLRPAHDLSAPARVVAPRAQADLLLLHVPLREVLRAPSRELVRSTIVGGRVVAGDVPG